MPVWAILVTAGGAGPEPGMGGWDWAFWVGGGVLGLAALVIGTWAMLWDRSRGRRRCPGCWYDMGGVPGLTCPECGREAKRERRLFRTRRRWAWAGVALLIAGAGAATSSWPRVTRGGWSEAVPIWALSLALPRFDKEAEDAVVTTAAMQLQPALRCAQVDTRWKRLLIAHGWAERLKAAPTESELTRAMLEAETLGLGAESRPLVQGLISLMHSEDAGMRLRAMTAAYVLADRPGRVLPALVGRLQDPDMRMRQTAAALIGRYGEDARSAVPALEDMSKDPSPEVRDAAWWALYEIRGKR